MKTALIGYGKMGRLLEERLTEKGHKVLAVIDPNYKGPFYPEDSKSLLSGAQVYASLEEAMNGPSGKSLKDADAAIEFTNPKTAPGNLLFLAREKIPAITGTTGWYENLPSISKAVNDSGTSLLWAPNFSLGVNLFYRIAAYAAKLMDPFPEYDAAGFEIHHNKKADSPSGTAKTLTEKVLAQMTRKKKAVYDMMERPPEAEELHYASLRVGSVFGNHSLFFDSPADTIEITHSARNREGLAAGTILAAQWLTEKKRTGVFTIDHVLEDLIPSA